MLDLKRYGCISCGKCRDVCVANKAGKLSITALVNGEDGSAWNCSFCWKCEDACPYDVDLQMMIIEQRKVGTPPPAYKRMVENIRQTGRGLTLTERVQEKRVKKGLSKIEEISARLLKILLTHSN